jgi:hypothetical protein
MTRMRVRALKMGNRNTTTMRRDEFKDGHKWKCEKCGQRYQVGLEIAKLATQEQAD